MRPIAVPWALVIPGSSITTLTRWSRLPETSGRRLLDVLDLHWYPEARGGDTPASETRIVMQGKGDSGARPPVCRPRARCGTRATTRTAGSSATSPAFYRCCRSSSSSIDTYYPGTKLAFTEFDYGGEYDISGGIATADVLGIFGRYDVYMAHYWDVDWLYDPTYTAAAYKLYRDYDGNHSAFADTYVDAATSDSEKSSIYASLDEDTSELHIILLSKTTDSLEGTLRDRRRADLHQRRGLGLQPVHRRASSGRSDQRHQRQQLPVRHPPLTAYHVVLQPDTSLPTRTPTAVGQPTRTPTVTRTPSCHQNTDRHQDADHD